MRERIPIPAKNKSRQEKAEEEEEEEEEEEDPRSNQSIKNRTHRKKFESSPITSHHITYEKRKKDGREKIDE